MQSVAVGWQVYTSTENPLDLGLVGLCIFLPLFFLALIGGHTADHYPRKKILLVCHLLLALCALGLYAFSSTPHQIDSLLPLYALLIFFGAVRAFSRPAGSAILGDTVLPEDLPAAVAIASSTWQIGAVLGPALGGLAYAAFASAGAVYALSCLCHLASALCVVFMQVAPLKPSARNLTWVTVLEGVRYIRSVPVLLGAMSLDLFAVLLGGSVALLPIYARDILHTGPGGLGLLRAAPALGAIATAIWLAYRPIRSHAGRTLFAGVAIFGVATCIFGLSTNFVLSSIALVTLGGADMLSVVVRQSLIQLGTPVDMRGRVSAVSQVFISASNELGEFESGFVAALVGAVATVVGGGLGTCLIAVSWKRLFPSLYAINRYEEARKA